MEIDKYHIKGYNGPITERTHLDCAREWNKLGFGNIDRLLLEQVLATTQTDQSEEIVVVDIGCGKEAELLKTVTLDPSVAPFTRKFLLEHPRLRLNLIGLTDAEDIQQVGQIIIHEEDVSKHIQYRVIPYTLTAAQTFESFLRKQNIVRMNLTLATWSLAYLSPNVFREVTTTTINHLQSGGRFIGVGYNDTVSGIGFKYHPNEDSVHFVVRHPQIPENLWEILLEEFTVNKDPELLRIESTTLIIEYLYKVISSSALQFSQREKQQLLDDLSSIGNLQNLVPLANTLKQQIRRLWENKFATFKTMKEDALSSIEASNPLITLHQVPPNLFSMQKQ